MEFFFFFFNSLFCCFRQSYAFASHRNVAVAATADVRAAKRHFVSASSCRVRCIGACVWHFFVIEIRVSRDWWRSTTSMLMMMIDGELIEKFKKCNSNTLEFRKCLLRQHGSTAARAGECRRMMCRVSFGMPIRLKLNYYISAEFHGCRPASRLSDTRRRRERVNGQTLYN